MSHTFVIMEAAACHDLDLGKAERLVDLAAEVGADAVKFQWLSSPEALAKRRRAPNYLTAYANLAFPEWWLGHLASRCRAAGVEFMCTAYLPEDIATVAFHVKRFKIASFEAMDTEFVVAHTSFVKPVIISAGMASDLEEPLAAFRAACDCRPADVSLLHCVSAYPCPDDQINLSLIRQGFSGLSDHTRHPWTGALAVAAGAKIIEFHARLYDTDPHNADFLVARTPDLAADYVRNIRQAERMMGTGIKVVMPAEAPMLRYRVAS